MGALDRRYEIEMSLKDGKLTKKQDRFEIYSTDKDILKFYITLKDVDDVIVSNTNLHTYDAKMIIVRPELVYKEVACEIDDNKDRLVCEIANDMLSIAGTYKFELRVEKDGEIVTSSPGIFEVKKSIADGLRSN